MDADKTKNRFSFGFRRVGISRCSGPAGFIVGLIVVPRGFGLFHISGSFGTKSFETVQSGLRVDLSLPSEVTGAARSGAIRARGRCLFFGCHEHLRPDVTSRRMGNGSREWLSYLFCAANNPDWLVTSLSLSWGTEECEIVLLSPQCH
jgi:hypothetical protein